MSTKQHHWFQPDDPEYWGKSGHGTGNSCVALLALMLVIVLVLGLVFWYLSTLPGF